MTTINQRFKRGQEYTFSISQVPEISTDTAVIYSIQDTSENLTVRKINDTIFSLTYNGTTNRFTSNLQLIINGISGYEDGLEINIEVDGVLAKDPVRIYNPNNYTIYVNIYRKGANAPELDIYYCVGNAEGTFTHYTNSTDYGSTPILNIEVGPGKSAWIYSDTMIRWANDLSSNYISIRTPDYDLNNIQLSGNIMSLISGDLQTMSFYGLFEKFKTLGSVSEDFLPATTLATNCYYGMFYNCYSLTTAPALPATSLAGNCYYCMFMGCNKLTTAPSILPATSLSTNCYVQMFKGCASLENAPELPATTLASDCYYELFYNCSKINYIKALFTTTPGSGYTTNWVNGVSSTGTFVKSHQATWDVTGTSGIPSNWTVITDAN